MMWIIELLSVSIICLCHQAHTAQYQRKAMLDDFKPTHGSLYKGSTRSKVECSTRCESVTGLRSFFYVDHTHDCECYDTSFATSDGLNSVPSAKYYEKQGCDTSSPMVASVLDDQLSASSVYSSDYLASRGRLDDPMGWSAASDSIQEYIKVDFLNIRVATAVTTKGDPDYTNAEWVTSYKVLISTDCITYTTLSDGNGNDRVFAGNTDYNSQVTNAIDPPVSLRCLKVNPITWHVWISLRFDVMGCVL